MTRFFNEERALSVYGCTSHRLLRVFAPEIGDIAQQTEYNNIWDSFFYSKLCNFRTSVTIIFLIRRTIKNTHKSRLPTKSPQSNICFWHQLILTLSKLWYILSQIVLFFVSHSHTTAAVGSHNLYFPWERKPWWWRHSCAIYCLKKEEKLSSSAVPCGLLNFHFIIPMGSESVMHQAVEPDAAIEVRFKRVTILLLSLFFSSVYCAIRVKRGFSITFIEEAFDKAMRHKESNWLLTASLEGK